MTTATPVDDNPWDSPLFLSLKPSRRLVFLFASMHLCALLSVLPMDIPLPLKLVALIVLPLSLRFTLRRYAWLDCAQAVRGLHWQPAEGWSLVFGDGEVLAVRLLPGTWVQASVVLLHCRCRGMVRDVKVPVLGDMLDDAEFRRLRARLRWGAPEPGSAGGS